MKNFYLLFLVFLQIICFAENPHLQNETQIGWIKKIETYFSNGLDSVKSDFKQINSRGFVYTGKIFFKRNKGLLKLSYDDPNPSVVIVKDYKLIHFDRDLKEKTIISVYSSPLSFFLEKKVDLNQNVKVVAFNESENSVEITLKKKGDEDEGAVTLLFSKKPFQLQGWTILESNKYGKQIQMILENADFNASISDKEFESFS